jgi:hypothetical protein
LDPAAATAESTGGCLCGKLEAASKGALLREAKPGDTPLLFLSHCLEGLIIQVCLSSLPNLGTDHVARCLQTRGLKNNSHARAQQRNRRRAGALLAQVPSACAVRSKYKNSPRRHWRRRSTATLQACCQCIALLALMNAPVCVACVYVLSRLGSVFWGRRVFLVVSTEMGGPVLPDGKSLTRKINCNRCYFSYSQKMSSAQDFIVNFLAGGISGA